MSISEYDVRILIGELLSEFPLLRKEIWNKAPVRVIDAIENRAIEIAKKHNLIECKHFDIREIGMVGHYPNTHDCGYGCKVVQCGKCEDVFESHSASYGCSYQAI